MKRKRKLEEMNSLRTPGLQILPLLALIALVGSSADVRAQVTEQGPAQANRKQDEKNLKREQKRSHENTKRSEKTSEKEAKLKKKLPYVDPKDTLNGRLVPLRNAQGSLKSMMEISVLVEKHRKEDPLLKKACDCGVKEGTRKGPPQGTSPDSLPSGCLVSDFQMLGYPREGPFPSPDPVEKYPVAKRICMSFHNAKQKGLSESCRNAAYWCNLLKDGGNLDEEIEARRNRIEELKAAARESLAEANARQKELGLAPLPTPPELVEGGLKVISEGSAPGGGALQPH